MAQKTKTKIKRKRWYPIVAPRIFRESVLGETLLADPTAMIGRTVTQNLMNLTGDVRKQNINIKFLVKNVQNNNGITEVIGYHIIPASVKRLVRRRSEKIDMSIICHTADNKRVKVKPLVVTKTLARSSVLAALNHLIVETLTKSIKKMSYDALVNDLVSYKLQRSLRERLNKVFPLKVCEIRYMQIEKEKKPGEEGKKEAETPKEEVREPEEKEEAKPEVKEDTKKEEKAPKEVKEEKREQGEEKKEGPAEKEVKKEPKEEKQAEEK